ncbi:MAG: fumarate hydratase [Oscillospiraceae bacterium]|nr:fumarate hydratase [Oscillospiraceae bacterium]
MREVSTALLAETVKELCISANKILPSSLAARISACRQSERNPLAAGILGDLERNLEAAKELDIPICQDTGMAVCFIEVGQEVLLTGEPYEDAINRGVREGYLEGLLRCSIVKDPLRRVNTGDNTPAVIHTRIVPGDRVKVTVAPKGFGSENMSRTKMFTPSAKPEEIVAFVVEAARLAGGNPCPPMVVGVGIGGDFEYCAYLSKKALCRDAAVRNPDPFYAGLEAEMLAGINALDIGPQGFGGETTALAVNIEQYPTHIAGLPVAVNIGCHVTRHGSAVL